MSSETRKTTETILGMVNQYYALSNLPYVPDLNTTINSKRGVEPFAEPTIIPSLRYMGIGIKGYYNIDDDVLSEAYNPRASNMDLYDPIPFRIVPWNEDLTPTERAMYRMRTLVTVGSNKYFAYWLKVLTFPTGLIQLTQTQLDGTEVPYNINPVNLTPVPVKAPAVPVVAGNLNTGRVSVQCQCEVTGMEVAEAINILRDGNLGYAKVSEYGFYTGEDRSVTGEDHNGQDITYTEAIYTQLASHRCTIGTDFSAPGSSSIESVIFTNGSLLIA